MVSIIQILKKRTDAVLLEKMGSPIKNFINEMKKASEKFSGEKEILDSICAPQLSFALNGEVTK